MYFFILFLFSVSLVLVVNSRQNSPLYAHEKFQARTRDESYPDKKSRQQVEHSIAAHLHGNQILERYKGWSADYAALPLTNHPARKLIPTGSQT